MSNDAKERPSEHDVFIEIDADKLLGQKVDDRELLSRIGDAAVDIIRERTINGRFKNRAKNYTQDYTESVPYVVAGKDGTVNLTLTGSMLDNLGVRDITNGVITIGFSSALEAAKAFNHNRGDSKGMPKREFMYLSGDECRDLEERFKLELPESQEDRENRLGRFLAFLGGFGLGS